MVRYPISDTTNGQGSHLQRFSGRRGLQGFEKIMKGAMSHLSVLSFFSSALYEDRLIAHNLLRWKYCLGLFPTRVDTKILGTAQQFASVSVRGQWGHLWHQIRGSKSGSFMTSNLFHDFRKPNGSIGDL